jgi:hypothetical protein
MVFAILILVFLFAGEPDLWDNLHEMAMKATTVNKDCK